MFERRALLEKFHAMVARGEPIIGGGAGTGLSAKCEEAGGIDLIVIYNSGRYRMAGRGSLAGLLAYGDANQIVVEMAAEVLPVVRHTPVLAGVNGTDPFRRMEVFLDQLKALGFAGVQNFPTVGLFDGIFRANLEETGMGYGLEVDMIRTAHDEGLADHALCVRRGRRRGDGRGRRRHRGLPPRADDRRLDRRRHRAEARGLPGQGRRLGRGGAPGEAGRHRAGPRRAGRAARGRGVHPEQHQALPRLLRRLLDGAPAGRGGADRADQEGSSRSAAAEADQGVGRESDDRRSGDRRPRPMADRGRDRDRDRLRGHELALPPLDQGSLLRAHGLPRREGRDQRRRLRLADHPRHHAGQHERPADGGHARQGRRTDHQGPHAGRRRGRVLRPRRADREGGLDRRLDARPPHHGAGAPARAARPASSSRRCARPPPR